jgi:hypothetical protein
MPFLSHRLSSGEGRLRGGSQAGRYSLAGGMTAWMNSAQPVSA